MFNLKCGTQTNLNMLNLMVMLIFSLQTRNTPLNLIQNSLFKMKQCTQIDSNVLHSRVMCAFPFGTGNTFQIILVPKIKIVCFSRDLLRNIRIYLYTYIFDGNVYFFCFRKTNIKVVISFVKAIQFDYVQFLLW